MCKYETVWGRILSVDAIAILHTALNYTSYINNWHKRSFILPASVCCVATRKVITPCRIPRATHPGNRMVSTANPSPVIWVGINAARDIDEYRCCRILCRAYLFTPIHEVTAAYTYSCRRWQRSFYADGWCSYHADVACDIYDSAEWFS